LAVVDATPPPPHIDNGGVVREEADQELFHLSQWWQQAQVSGKHKQQASLFLRFHLLLQRLLFDHAHHLFD